MKTFNNDPKTKEEYINKVKKEIECEKHKNVKVYDDNGGIPEEFKSLRKIIYAGLKEHAAKRCATYKLMWPINSDVTPNQLLKKKEDRILEAKRRRWYMYNWPPVLLDALPIGADLRSLWLNFFSYLLTDSQHGLHRIEYSDIAYPGLESDKLSSPILLLSSTIERIMAGENVSSESWDNFETQILKLNPEATQVAVLEIKRTVQKQRADKKSISSCIHLYVGIYSKLNPDFDDVYLADEIKALAYFHMAEKLLKLVKEL